MRRLRSCVAGVLLMAAPAFTSSAAAQVTGTPDTMRVTLAEGQTAEATLVITNAGSALTTLAAAPEPSEVPPGTPGDILVKKPSSFFSFLTITDSLQFFASKDSGPISDLRVWELTPELEPVREFEVAGLFPDGENAGMEWMPPEDAPAGHPRGTLWLIDLERRDVEPHICLVAVSRAALYEVGLDGALTGRSIELPIEPVPEWTYCTTVPAYVAYDDERDVFYYVDLGARSIWAVDIEGNVLEGYPVPATGYAESRARAALRSAFVSRPIASRIMAATDVPPGVPGTAVPAEIRP